MFKELSQLFSSVQRIKLLKFFAFQLEERTTAATAGATLGISKADAQKETAALARLGVLVAKRQGKNKTFSFNDSHPFAPAIRVFLGASTLPSTLALAKAFKGVNGITLLVATGMLALEPRSPIDLLIVTKKPNDPKLGRAVRKVESLSALPIRYVVLETVKYAERLEARDRLLRDVFEFGHRITLGRRH